MTSRAAEVVESELSGIAAPRLAAWSATLEGRADAGGTFKP